MLHTIHIISRNKSRYAGFNDCMGDEKDKQRVSLEGEEQHNEASVAGSITGKVNVSETSRMQFIAAAFTSVCVPSNRRHKIYTLAPNPIRLLPLPFR
jgi:hypothetical protein